MHPLLHKHPMRSALAALAVLSAIWGYNWVIMKQALRDAGAFDFAALLLQPWSLIADMLLIAAALTLLSSIAIRQHRRTHPFMGQE